MNKCNKNKSYNVSFDEDKPSVTEDNVQIDFKRNSRKQILCKENHFYEELLAVSRSTAKWGLRDCEFS